MPNVYECDDANIWSHLLNSSLPANAYATWEYGEALSQTCGYKKHYLIYSFGENIIAGLPLIHVKSMLFGNRLISLPFCEYGGPFVQQRLTPKETSDATSSLLNAADDLAGRLCVDYIELRHPSNFDEAMLIDRGLRKRQSYVTFKIDLKKGREQLWSFLDKKTRNAVRKAQKSGLEVEEITDPAQLKEYYMLYLKTQKRLGSPPHSLKLFQNLFSAFSTSKKMRMTLAKHHGQPVAGITVFFSGNSVFWWNNVSDIKHRSLNPTNLLLWNTIEWAVEKGHETMDLGRTRKPSTIHEFKGGWGGIEQPLIDYVRFLSAHEGELPDPSRGKYQILSRMWSLLPVAVARRIGPRIIKGIAL